MTAGAPCASRTGVTGKGAAALIGLGGLTTLITMGGPVQAALVLAAALLLAGHLLGFGAAATAEGATSTS